MSSRECNSCGEDISEARLRSLPTTTICVECAEARERAGKGTVRHRMNTTYHLDTGGEIGLVETTIVKGVLEIKEAKPITPLPHEE